MSLWKRILGWFTRDAMVVSPPESPKPTGQALEWSDEGGSWVLPKGVRSRTNPPVKCPCCREKTTGSLFQVGCLRLCERCATSGRVSDAAKRAGWKIKMVRT
jgi:hypothetical protein